MNREESRYSPQSSWLMLEERACRRDRGTQLCTETFSC